MSRRLSLVIDDAIHDLLTATAHTRGTKPSTLATTLLTHTLTGTPSLPPPGLPDEAADSPSGPRASWLQLHRDHTWRDEQWHALHHLQSAYPEIAELLHTNWHHDRFIRDGLLALNAWRTQLDTGIITDPRGELQWLTALRDFRNLADQHRRQHRHRDAPAPRPDDW